MCSECFFFLCFDRLCAFLRAFSFASFARAFFSLRLTLLGSKRMLSSAGMLSERREERRAVAGRQGRRWRPVRLLFGEEQVEFHPSLSLRLKIKRVLPFVQTSTHMPTCPPHKSTRI